MPSLPSGNRREFLTGHTIARAWQRAVERVTESEAAERATPQTYLLEIARRAMACDFQVYLNAGENPQAAEHAVETLAMLDTLEAAMTVFQPTSTISRINQKAAEGPVQVEPWLYELLCQAAELARTTGGAFDITSGPLTRTWGFLRREGRIPSNEEIAAALAAVGSDKIQFDEQHYTVQLAVPGMEINLGAIGKGYALDQCAAELTRRGVENFLLHGGHSSVLARGQRAGRDGWTVALRHPSRPQWRLGEILLRNQALGTSGSANQFFHYQGRRLGHVIDPRSGWPAQQLLSATVLAPTAAEADALSTAMFVLGLEASRDLCAQRSDIAAILVAPSQREGSLDIYTLGLDADDQWQLAPEWQVHRLGES